MPPYPKVWGKIFKPINASVIVLYDDRMNLELRHLRALVAVDDARTFTDAAISLGTSQASVSRSIAALERTLGVRVFQRTTRSVTPSAAGKRIIEHARRVLNEAKLLEEAARDHAGELRVGYAWSALGSRTLPCSAAGRRRTRGRNLSGSSQAPRRRAWRTDPSIWPSSGAGSMTSASLRR